MQIEIVNLKDLLNKNEYIIQHFLSLQDILID